MAWLWLVGVWTLMGMLVLSNTSSYTTLRKRSDLSLTDAAEATTGGNDGRHTPKVLLGFSTGHTGSTTIDVVLGDGGSGCPWEKRTGHFEKRFEPFDMVRSSKEEQCGWVRYSVVPQLRSETKDNSTYIDMGHFNNLGYTLECLAESPLAKTGELAWVRIRRNRYDIARSFSLKDFQSPCHNPWRTHDTSIFGLNRVPLLSYCPHSKENNHNTPIYLPVSDKVWMKLTPFQKFLWLADELEYRFHTFQEKYPYIPYYEVTWNFPEELKQGVADLRVKLHCNAPQEIPRHQTHVDHTKHKCLPDIQADLDYRRKVDYPKDIQKILFQYTTIDSFDLATCEESKEELEAALAQAL